MSSTDLPPSVLGTKEHWDDVYSSELANFEEIGDEGEIWFGEDSVENMVDWALENLPPSQGDSPFILEIGSGNGNLLFALYDAGYAPDRMCGIDYSADAVRLARAIGKSRPSEDDRGELKPDAIAFSTCDFLAEDVPALQSLVPSRSYLWDLVLDKGTFDAVALAGRSEGGAAPADSYPCRVTRVVKPGGYFLITSCNFTEEELRTKFANAETGLTYHSRIAFPTLSFGGKSGNVYSSVAFRKAA
ncbi:S-adenosyl-L-methionine-dependent methyltransferase [Sparassis latifolia]|uniref:Protein-lysine N-methyltransferase EFM4 n=1 Tax=Sparassis crispa TaxID=139825 RepID=A0A401H1U9_9APHY|nr:Protein-lysine N-methyltransferase efm4 [Sparassis crispa]GBE88388.1 Protein-lysine N-methyltransferase efm4 [Sparassis crispa]